MKKYLILTLVLVAGFLPAQMLTNDPSHSRLGFGATHLMISTVEGNFTDFTVNLAFSKEDMSDAKFTVKAKTASIDTGVEARNKHLKSADFFDVEKFPELKFVSTSITKVIGNQFALEGDLTLHGVTKKVTLKMMYNGNVFDDKSKERRYGFTITGNINKNDFGVGTSFPEAVVGNKIAIVSNLEFVKK